MQFVAIHPETGIRYQRESTTKAYRWCVVTPSRQVRSRTGEVWTRYAEVTWSTLAAPRVPIGAEALPARQVADPVELADLALERAQRHVAYCEREFSAEVARQEKDADRVKLQARYLASLKDRLATARKSLDAATQKLARARVRTDVEAAP